VGLSSDTSPDSKFSLCRSCGDKDSEDDHDWQQKRRAVLLRVIQRRLPVGAPQALVGGVRLGEKRSPLPKTAGAREALEGVRLGVRRRPTLKTAETRQHPIRQEGIHGQERMPVGVERSQGVRKCYQRVMVLESCSQSSLASRLRGVHQPPGQEEPQTSSGQSKYRVRKLFVRGQKSRTCDRNSELYISVG
jgi:hypothetical protein